MGRGRRLAITGEENFQAWLANNWDRPLSDEVQRLQSEVKRLEAMHATDSRRLLKAGSEWWSLIRKGFLAGLGLVALVLWYVNGYLETRGALKEVCAFIAREASAKTEDDSKGVDACP